MVKNYYKQNLLYIDGQYTKTFCIFLHRTDRVTVVVFTHRYHRYNMG